MSNSNYSASMVSCLFWFQETRKTAELIYSGCSAQEIREKAVTDNIYQVRSPDRAVRIVGVSFKRLAALNEELLSQFIQADIKTAKLILLLAIMKTDLLFYEFMHTVFKQTVVLGQKSLSDSNINVFFDSKISESAEVAAFSESAIKKLKQTYVKFLIEANILTSAKDKYVQMPMIDYRLHAIIKEAGFLPYLSTLTGEEENG